jgi:phenylpropionate dioxygenase-like ring-hydroxylating dioxygenase large terminal subunit
MQAKQFHLTYVIATALLSFLCHVHQSVEGLSTSSAQNNNIPSTTACDNFSTLQSTTTKVNNDVVTSLNREELDSRKFPRTWVPLASTYELDPNRPSPLQFLGQKYVCYQDNDQRWVVMDDSCPHRLVPLSEGRVNRDSNSLQCSYHGWEFNSNGSCIRIPQATPEIEKAAFSSKRACVASYPVHIEKNVIWFWPWKEDVLSVAGKKYAHPEGLMEGTNDNPSTYTRDLPYGWDALVENLIDPSHVPFAHHGLQGKRDDAIPITMTVPVSMGEEGFKYEFEDRTMKMIRKGEGRFQAPYTVSYDAKYESETPRDFKLSVLCIPTKPGWSRAILLGSPLDKKEDKDGESKKDVEVTNKKEYRKKIVLSFVFKIIPVWFVHQLSNRFLDSDLAFLHYQEQERKRNDSYYMPSPSDRCIAALRSWVPKYTDMDKEVIPPPLPRSQMFDRWSQHTSQCVHCLQGLKTLEKVRRSAYGILAISVLGFKYNVAKVTTLLCLGIIRLVAKLERTFKEGEFKHYENE